jgi:bifunctional DNA-binding transcriptional regulator/antitoxin component of YhaV-PrlF toxin-antitoxin module
MATTRIDDGKVHIPEEIRAAAQVGEGMELKVDLTTEGILLRTPHGIDPSQARFWTPEWQAKEREADEEIKAGKGTIYYSTEEFLASLEDAAIDDADV